MIASKAATPWTISPSCRSAFGKSVYQNAFSIRRSKTSTPPALITIRTMKRQPIFLRLCRINYCGPSASKRQPNWSIEEQMPPCPCWVCNHLINPDYALGSGHHSITDEFFELSGFNLDNEIISRSRSGTWEFKRYLNTAIHTWQKMIIIIWTMIRP